MTDQNERIATLEANQKNTDRALDHLSITMDSMSKLQPDVAVILSTVNLIADRQKVIEKDQKDLTAKISKIETSAAINKTKIAAISAVVTSVVGVAMFWIKQKLA